LADASKVPSALAHSAPALICSAPLTLVSAPTQPAPVVSSAPTTSAISAAGSRKRRYSRPVGAVKETAANAVIEAAKSQKEYYETKLQLAKEKHGAKMRILALKEQILKKKLAEE